MDEYIGDNFRLQDPMFEDVKAHETDETPYISSLMESRYLIAAVICNDMIRLTNLKVNPIIQNLGYLRYKSNTLPFKILIYIERAFSLQKDYSRVHTLHAPRSLANSMTALHYAIKMGNLKAIDILSKEDNSIRVSAPKKYIESVGKLVASKESQHNIYHFYLYNGRVYRVIHFVCYQELVYITIDHWAFAILGS